MESLIQLSQDAWAIVNIEGLYFKIKLTFFSEVCFLSKQTAKTVMKCHILRQYIWVFTVCNKITHPHQIQLSTERPYLRGAGQHKIYCLKVFSRCICSRFSLVSLLLYIAAPPPFYQIFMNYGLFQKTKVEFHG